MVPPNAIIEALVPRDKGKDINAGDGKGSYGDLLNAAFGRIDMAICYCSSLGDCWTVDNAGTRAMGSCPRPSASSFRQ